MTALYVERYLNFGLTREELQGGKPIIGIAQTGTDLAPCNRHHLELAQRVQDGIRDAGGMPLEFPVHPIQETGKRPDRGARPQPGLSGPGRGPARLSDRRRGADHRLRQDHAGLPDGARRPSTSRRSCCPAGRCWTAGGKGELAGSGTVVWEARRTLAAGEIDYEEFMEMVRRLGAVGRPLQHDGHRPSMNSLAEALGMSLPGCAAIPAPYRERGQMAYETGQRIVEMVREDLRPSEIMTRAAFENAIVVRLGDRRLDQLPAAHHRHRPAHGRRARRSRTGSGSATTSRCWSTAAGRAIIWARLSTAPAACPR